MVFFRTIGSGSHGALLLFLQFLLMGEERSNPEALIWKMLQGMTIAFAEFKIYMKLLDEITHQHRVKHHHYDDDIGCIAQPLANQVILEAGKVWMGMNRLYPSKTKWLSIQRPSGSMEFPSLILNWIAAWRTI